MLDPFNRVGFFPFFLFGKLENQIEMAPAIGGVYWNPSSAMIELETAGDIKHYRIINIGSFIFYSW